MTGIWLVSYLVLWGLALVEALVILALAREIEALHTRLTRIEDRLAQTSPDEQRGP